MLGAIPSPFYFIVLLKLKTTTLVYTILKKIETAEACDVSSTHSVCLLPKLSQQMLLFDSSLPCAGRPKTGFCGSLIIFIYLTKKHSESLIVFHLF